MGEESREPQSERPPEREPPHRPAQGRPARVAVLSIVFFAVLTMTLPGLFRTPFHTHGETREALVVRQMVHENEWILPLRNGVDIPSKPPLFHWLAAGISRAAGEVSPATIRMASVLPALVAALLVTGLAARTWGPRAGLLSGLVLVTAFEWQRSATNARVDMMLAFSLTLVLVGLHRAREQAGSGARLLVHVGAALAVLSKGPMILAIPALTVALLCLAEGSLQLLRRLAPLRGAMIVLVVAGSWYTLAGLEGGRPFLERHLLFENLHRLSGGSTYEGGHHHGAGYLLASLLAGALPWTLLLLVIGAQARQQRTGRVALLLALLNVAGVVLLPESKSALEAYSARLLGDVLPSPLVSLLPLALLLLALLALLLPALRMAVNRLGPRDPRLLFSLWSYSVFVLFSLPASKRGVYLLPMYPALALLVGAWWSRASIAVEPRPATVRGLEVVAAGLAVVLIFLAGITAAELGGVPTFSTLAPMLPAEPAVSLQVLSGTFRDLLPRVALAFLAAAALSLLLAPLLRRGHIHALVPLVAAITLCLSYAIRTAVFPAIAEARTTATFVARARQVLPAGTPATAYRDVDEGVAFHWGHNIPVVTSPQPLEVGELFLLTRTQWEEMPAAQRTTLEPLATARSSEPTRGPDMIFALVIGDGTSR